MNVYWSLKQIPELSGRSWQERRNGFRRFRSHTFRARVDRWSITAWVAPILIVWGSAFASSFLSDVPGACVLAVGGLGAIWLHFLVMVNHMGRCLRSGEFLLL
jgi:hypothetical protein